MFFGWFKVPKGRGVVFFRAFPQLSCLVKIPAAFPLRSWLCQAGRASPPLLPPKPHRSAENMFDSLGCYASCPSERHAQTISVFSKSLAAVRKQRLSACTSPRWRQKDVCGGMSQGVMKNSMCSGLGDDFLLPMTSSFLQPCSVTSQISLAVVHCGHT